MPTTPVEDARRLLRAARTIAVVGVSSDPTRPSNEVAQYLIAAGYEVSLVNPAEPGPIFGLPVYDTLAEVPGHIDIVDVFRRPQYVPPVVEEAIAVGAGAVWMQLEIINEDAASAAREAGLEVVMDRCTKIEHGMMTLLDSRESGGGSR
jgi:predicted CoA-binding protein